jgi:hypothetical protein
MLNFLSTITETCTNCGLKGGTPRSHFLPCPKERYDIKISDIQEFSHNAVPVSTTRAIKERNDGKKIL